MRVFLIDVDAESVEQLMIRTALWLDDSRLGPLTRELFGDIMSEAVQQRFATESNRGEAWEPLTAATIARRLARGFPGAHPINVRTGQMRSFLIHSTPRPQAASDGVEYIWPESSGGELYMKMLRSTGADSRTPARPVIDADQTHVNDFIGQAMADFERYLG